MTTGRALLAAVSAFGIAVATVGAASAQTSQGGGGGDGEPHAMLEQPDE
jgi:hypothetical protein